MADAERATRRGRAGLRAAGPEPARRQRHQRARPHRQTRRQRARSSCSPGLNDEHFGVRRWLRARRTTWSRAGSNPRCCGARCCTRSSANAPSSPPSTCTRASCAPRRTPGWSAACCPPRCCPTTRGVDIVARTGRAAQNALLGGDFYDFVQTPDGTVHVMVGDVAGHGPDEAALGVALRIAWRALTFAGLRGNERMRQLERMLRAERPGERYLRDGDQPRDRRPTAGASPRCAPDIPACCCTVPSTVEWLEPPAGPALGLLPATGRQPARAARRARPAAAHRRPLRGAFRPGQRTARRGRAARVGPVAGGAARRGVRRRAHRRSRGSRARRTAV